MTVCLCPGDETYNCEKGNVGLMAWNKVISFIVYQIFTIIMLEFNLFKRCRNFEQISAERIQNIDLFFAVFSAECTCCDIDNIF